MNMENKMFVLLVVTPFVATVGSLIQLINYGKTNFYFQIIYSALITIIIGVTKKYSDKIKMDEEEE